MLKGIDLSQRFEFSCKDDKENPTVFVLRPLSGLEMMDMSQFMKGKELIFNKDYVLDLLGKAILEIKNPDIVGTAIGDYILSLSSTNILELINEVGKINNITEDEAKN